MTLAPLVPRMRETAALDPTGNSQEEGGLSYIFHTTDPPQGWALSPICRIPRKQGFSLSSASEELGTAFLRMNLAEETGSSLENSVLFPLCVVILHCGIPLLLCPVLPQLTETGAHSYCFSWWHTCKSLAILTHRFQEKYFSTFL